MAGRPRGHPKSGGRQKGTANKVTATTRERIEKEADPIGFLVNVVNGESVEVADPTDPSATTAVYPSYEQRQDAAKTLAKKVLPDMKAVEHSGDLAVHHENWLSPHSYSQTYGNALEGTSRLTLSETSPVNLHISVQVAVLDNIGCVASRAFNIRGRPRRRLKKLRPYVVRP